MKATDDCARTHTLATPKLSAVRRAVGEAQNGRVPRLPADVSAVAEPILRDARAMGIVDLELVADVEDQVAASWVSETPEGERRAWIRRVGDTAASGLAVALRDDPGVNAWRVAEVVQEHIIESGDNTFPACPAMPSHPLSLAPPDRHDVWPHWRCRSGHDVDIALGELGEHRS